MKTSTKVLIILTAIFIVPNIFLTRYLFAAFTPTETGFTLSFDALAWTALAFQAVLNILMTILFFKFIKTQRLTNAIFFSAFPLTLVYAFFMVYVTDVKNLGGTTAQAVRATLKISAESTNSNNYLWAILATLAYLVSLFLILLFSCRPLSKVVGATEKLGDGRIKMTDFKIGGGKQFKQIENSLNKINFNYKEKENKIRQTNLDSQNVVSKQFLKFLGKQSVAELELGHQVKKTATILCCKLAGTSESKTLTLEENFNYINSYIKIVAPLTKRFGGFVDKYYGEGILAVFEHAQDAVECANLATKSIAVKNKSQKNLPNIEAMISITTGELTFGITGDDSKSPTILSENIISLAWKMQEINQFIGSKLLISQNTLGALNQSYNFAFRYVGDLTEDIKISVYESLEVYPKTKKQKLLKHKDKFEEGVRAYEEKDYQRAKTIFGGILKNIPDDKPSFVYFNRASEKLKEVA